MTRNIFRVAALVVASTPLLSLAQPSLAIVNNNDGSVTVQVVTDDSGSIATEITAVDGGFLGTGDITFTGAFIADPATFDTSNPGMNPITGGITEGLYLDALATNEIFASFGTGILGVGTFDFLTITYEGTGMIDAFGIIAQQGVNHDAFASITIVPEPAAASLVALACAGPFLRRRR